MQYEYFYGAQAEQFSFYRIPKALFTEPNFRELSTDAKVLYGILLDRMSLSLKNQWLDAQNKVYIIFTVDEIIYIYRMRQISGKEQHLFRFFQQVMQHGIKVVTLEYSLRDRLHEYRLGMKIENYAARHKLPLPW